VSAYSAILFGPAQLTGLTATATSSTTINVSWNAYPGATAYQVRRNGTLIATPTGTTYTNSGHTASTLYTYAVRPVVGGVGVASAEASIVVTTATAAGGLAANAYSTYETRVVDPATASDVAGGTARTVSVAGVQSTYQCYKTVNYGVTDWLRQGGRRLIVKGGTYSITSDISFPPQTGVSDSARVVLMGDPGDSMPVLDLVGPSRRICPNATNAANFGVLRKLRLINSVGASADEHGPVKLSYPDGAFFADNWIFEYLDIDQAKTPTDSGPNVAGIMLRGHSGAVIRYNKIRNVVSTGGAYNQNYACVQAYDHAGAHIYNNEFSSAGQGVYNKRNPSGGAPWLIYNNVINLMGQHGVLFSISAGGNPAHIDHEVYGNLIYAVNCGVQALVSETATQSTGIKIYQNTFGHDAAYAVWLRGVTAAVIHSNMMTAQNRQIVFETAGARSNSIAECNFNGYQTASGQRWTLNLYGSPERDFSSLTTWKTADSVAGSPETSTDPDASARSVASLLLAYTNHTARDYTLKTGSPFFGGSKTGGDIGYSPSNCGAGW
jgi:hypothetical protein